MVAVLHKLDSDFMVGDGQYLLVAILDTNDPNLAFEKTNHIDDDWRNNPEVLKNWAELDGMNRSTSVGDLIVVDGVVNEVAPIGFKKFPLVNHENADV